MNADNMMTVVLLFTGIIVVPTFFISVLQDAIYRKERRCSNHPSRSKSNIS
jgi:hypothetical protein